MMDDLADLIVKHARDLFEPGERRKALLSTLMLEVDDLVDVSSEDLLKALEPRALDHTDVESLLDLAAPHSRCDEDGVASALGALRVGNYAEAERLLEGALDTDLQHQARAAAPVALLLSPSFMR